MKNKISDKQAKKITWWIKVVYMGIWLAVCLMIALSINWLVAWIF